ncbi:hypothetical protein [Treponema sp.]|uniref:hypothetical protein n=1 Tax=Treponema sp. TaxID=166 RepID=UPI003EFE60E4
MRKDKHSRRHTGNWKSGKKDFDEKRTFQAPKPVFKPTIKSVPLEQIQQDEEAIRKFKSANQPVCEVCGQGIRDISTAINSRNSEGLIHFDCALESLSKRESLDPGDKLAYIGQGRFGVIHFASPADTKHFTIRKIIEWEEKDKKPEWRSEIADLYSRIK